MTARGSIRWIALALLGLLIAVALALAASHLASQQIGIASESVSAGDSLAPPITSVHGGRKEGSGKGKSPVESERQAESEPSTESEPQVETEPSTETEPQVEPEPSPEPENSESLEPSPTPTEGDDGGGGGGGGGGRDD
jgi:outer membrane biosynthesis protein TonB